MREPRWTAYEVGMPAWQRQPRMGGTFTRLKMWRETPSGLPVWMKLTRGVETQRRALSSKARIPTPPRAALEIAKHVQSRLFRPLERLASRSTVLGLFEKRDCSLEERQLLPGDTFLLYTDGAPRIVQRRRRRIRSAPPGPSVSPPWWPAFRILDGLDRRRDSPV